MSGFEVAGIVLAGLPLLVNQLDNYVQGLKTLKSFRTREYLRDIQRHRLRISTQKALFRGTLEKVLGDVVDDDEIYELIDNPEGPLWKDNTLTIRLRKSLGQDYDLVVDNMTELSSLLNKLCQQLDLRPSVSLEVAWSDLSVARREAKKLRDILSKSIYSEMLASIESTNTILQTLVDGASQREQVRKKGKGHKLLISQYRSLRDRAGSLYNAFIRGNCWRCLCRDTHHIHFQLQSNYDIESREIPSFRLRVGKPDLPERPLRAWKEVEVKCLEVQSHESSNTLSPISGSSLNSSNINTQRKEVRFALVSAATEAFRCPRPQTVSNPNPISDLCASIFASNFDGKAQNPIGFITDEARPTFQHQIYVLNAPALSQQPKPLKSLLSSSNVLQSSLRGETFLTRRDRLNLATNLACGVFQFHGSWLNAHWKTEDIFLTHSDNVKPRLESAHLFQRLSEGVSNSTHQIASHYSDVIPNPILFPLGLALVELSLCQTLEKLRIASDDNPIEAVANLSTACRNFPSVRDESGLNYLKVVKKCLYWSETEEVGLESEEFQESMFYAIIKPLLDELRNFEGN